MKEDEYHAQQQQQTQKQQVSVQSYLAKGHTADLLPLKAANAYVRPSSPYNK